MELAGVTYISTGLCTMISPYSSTESSFCGWAPSCGIHGCSTTDPHSSTVCHPPSDLIYQPPNLPLEAGHVAPVPACLGPCLVHSHYFCILPMRSFLHHLSTAEKNVAGVWEPMTEVDPRENHLGSFSCLPSHQKHFLPLGKHVPIIIRGIHQRKQAMEAERVKLDSVCGVKQLWGKMERTLFL